MSIWFTSDLHFNHNKSFVVESRGFQNVDEMNNTIVNNWNSVVSPFDDVYILGDLMLADTISGLSLISSLNGKLHIILGNHDTENRVMLYRSLKNVVEICYATVLQYGNYKFYLSHYPTVIQNSGKSLKHIIINLFGHTHQKTNFYNDNYNIYHVGVDSHNCTPVEISTIIQECREKYENNCLRNKQDMI